MRIETKMLSKNALVELVDMIRENSDILPDELIRDWYRNDLINQLQIISEQLEEIEKNLSKKKLSRANRLTLTRKHNMLRAQAKRKITLIEELVNAAK